MPELSNPGSPKVFSGARARFKLQGMTIGYAGGVSGEETIDYQPVDVLDLLEVKEHVPVAYRTSLSAQIFRVIGNSLKKQGVFPKMEEIITSESLSAVVENAEPTPTDNGGPVQQYIGVRAAGHTWDIPARGLVSENVTFVAIRTMDESEQALA